MLLKDNELSISLTQSAEQHSYIKYINIQHHYLRVIVKDRELIIE